MPTNPFFNRPVHWSELPMPTTQKPRRKSLAEMTTEKERARFIEVLQSHIDIVRKERSYVKAIIEAGLAEGKHNTMLDALNAELNWRRGVGGPCAGPVI